MSDTRAQLQQGGKTEIDSKIRFLFSKQGDQRSFNVQAVLAIATEIETSTEYFVTSVTCN